MLIFVPLESLTFFPFFKTKVKLNKFRGLNELKKNKIYYIDIPLDQKKLTKTKINLYIKRSFQAGLNLLKKKKSLALINGPISKKHFLRKKFGPKSLFIHSKRESSSAIFKSKKNEKKWKARPQSTRKKKLPQ